MYLRAQIPLFYGLCQFFLTFRTFHWISSNCCHYVTFIKLCRALFSCQARAIGIDDLVNRVCTQKSLVFIDLSEVAAIGIFWSPEVMAIVLNEILMKLRRNAEDLYRQEKLLNLLVAVDEAHRFIPSGQLDDEDISALKETLVTSSRETRKYGFGWLFISTSVSGLESEVLKQMRIYFFGYGLSWGGELRALRELIGEERYLSLSEFQGSHNFVNNGRKTISVHGLWSSFASCDFWSPTVFQRLRLLQRVSSLNQRRTTRRRTCELPMKLVVARYNRERYRDSGGQR